MGLEDEQTVTAELRHEQKSKEVAITRLSIEVQTLTSGNKALAKDALHEKLAAAESKSKADTAKWATERQRLKDDVTRSQQKELQAKTERDAANEAINQVRTEEEEFKQWTISKRSAYLTNSDNRLFSRSAAEELTPIRDQYCIYSSLSLGVYIMLNSIQLSGTFAECSAIRSNRNNGSRERLSVTDHHGVVISLPFRFKPRICSLEQSDLWAPKYGQFTTGSRRSGDHYCLRKRNH